MKELEEITGISEAMICCKLKGVCVNEMQGNKRNNYVDYFVR